MVNMQGKKTNLESEVYEKEIVDRILSKIKINGDECWEWQGCKSNGYGVIRAFRRNYFVHRLTFQIWKKTDVEEMCVCHKCDNPCCCNPDHMFLGTQSENMKDATKKKRFIHGEKHYNRKLNEKDILEIRDLLKMGFSQRRVAKIFNISQSCVGDINLKYTWKHI